MLIKPTTRPMDEVMRTPCPASSTLLKMPTFERTRTVALTEGRAIVVASVTRKEIHKHTVLTLDRFSIQRSNPTWEICNGSSTYCGSVQAIRVPVAAGKEVEIQLIDPIVLRRGRYGLRIPFRIDLPDDWYLFRYGEFMELAKPKEWEHG